MNEEQAIKRAEELILTIKPRPIFPLWVILRLLEIRYPTPIARLMAFEDNEMIEWWNGS